MTLERVLGWLRPARTVPITRWRSTSRWSGKPATLFVLVLGLWLFGTGEALVVVADQGNGPWTVLAQGLSIKTGLNIGWTTFAISAAVLLLWIPLKERPGLGTFANAVVIALALEVGVGVIPHPHGFALQLVWILVGLACIGLGSGMYLTTNLGPGPRDGWMTGIHYATGWPIPAVRLGIEVLVTGIGWLLGGTVGIGTVLFALLVGPFVGYGLQFVGKVAGATEVAEVSSEPELEA